MTVMQDPIGKQSGAPMGLEEPGKTETIRQMIAPTFSPGGETGLFLLGIIISVAFVFASCPSPVASRLATGLSVVIAAEFIAMAVPGCVLAVVLCGRFFPG